MDPTIWGSNASMMTPRETKSDQPTAVGYSLMASRNLSACSWSTASAIVTSATCDFVSADILDLVSMLVAVAVVDWEGPD